MSVYRVSPGAWLSGYDALLGVAAAPIDKRRAAQAPIDINRQAVALAPIDRLQAASAPIDRPPTGHAPIDSPRSAAAPIDVGGMRGGWPQPSPAPRPRDWDGVDPAWSYASEAALRSIALRKTRLTIIRGETPLSDEKIRRASLLGQPLNGTSLWRWAPQFRHSALLAELQGRCQVTGHSLWVLQAAGTAGNARPPTQQQIRAIRVFTLDQALSEPELRDQVDKVLRAAVEREDRLPEILSQADDFWPFFEAVIGLSLDTAPRLTELIDVVHTWGLHVTMALKNAVAAQRPFQVSSLVVPVMPTPAHGSLPSGHATMSALLAEVLTLLLFDENSARSRERAGELDRLSRRIAFNRVVAGLHFPYDNLVGYALGTQLARILAALCASVGEEGKAACPRLVDSQRIRALSGKLELREGDGARLPATVSRTSLAPAEGLRTLWAEVKRELAQLRT